MRSSDPRTEDAATEDGTAAAAADDDASRSLASAPPRAWGTIYLKGLCMGAADAVPGVSGGTIALITGIYERLIGAVTAIDPSRIGAVLGGVRPSGRASARRALREMDAFFLIALGGGIATAVVTVTRLIDVALESVPVLTFGFFFGLIAASAIALYEEVSFDTSGRIAAGIAGFALAFVVSGQAAASFGTGLLVTLVAGAIAVSAMILPGISGSLLLILLGQYEYMVETLRQFVDRSLAVVTGGSVDAVVDPATTVVAFMAGALVGLFTISHAIRWALEHYREATLAFLVSLIVGALRAPVANAGLKLSEAGRSWTTELVAFFLVAAVAGAAVVLLVDRYAGGIDIDG